LEEQIEKEASCAIFLGPIQDAQSKGAQLGAAERKKLMLLLVYYCVLVEVSWNSSQIAAKLLKSAKLLYYFQVLLVGAKKMQL